MKTAIQREVLRRLNCLEETLSELGQQLPKVENLLRDAIAEARHEFEVYSVRDDIENCEYYFLRRVYDRQGINKDYVKVLEAHRELMNHWDWEVWNGYCKEAGLQ